MGKERYRSTERPRRRQRGSQRDRRAQIRKGIGACIFTLGIPMIIAGGIILIVANTKDNPDDVPPAFRSLGPILVTLSVIFFVVGSILTDMINIGPCISYCFPDDPKAFCWKRCPLLYSVFRPHEVSLLHRRDAGLHALQSAPSKPVLKKPSALPKDPVPVKRGVRFSGSDVETGNVRMSTSSDQSDLQNNSPNTSLLSLRHCKIHPKEGVKFSLSESDDTLREVSEDKDGSCVFTLSGSVDQCADADNVFPEHVTDIDQADDIRSYAQTFIFQDSNGSDSTGSDSQITVSTG